MNELVEYIAEDLNTPSQETKTRIGHELNVRYKQVTSSIGMLPTRRTQQTLSLTTHRITSVSGMEKIEAIYVGSPTTSGQMQPIKEITIEEMRPMVVRDDEPTCWAVNTATSGASGSNVGIMFDAAPTDIVTLTVIGSAVSTTLTNNDQPAFPESFHDILIYGVKADEYRRREKMQLARECEMLFIQRLSDLRMFLAKTAYMDSYRGKHAPAEGWWDYESKRY